MSQTITRTRSTPSGPVIEVTGDLDHYSAPEVRSLLPGLVIGRGRQLVVDLGGLTFCDSSGITVLLAARNHALASGGTIVLAAVPAMTSRILSIAGLDAVLPAYRTAEAAEAAWSRPTD